MTILENLQKIADKKLKDQKIELKSNDLLKKIGIDSLDLLDMVVELEEIYKIEIDDATLLKINTVQDLIDAIEKLI